MPPASNSLYRDRSEMLRAVREFFFTRSLLEVDCPALNPYPQNDTGIEVIMTECGSLHTSPEYQMKRLLAQGLGDLFYLGHVFRKEEKGRLHNPEFTMIEWYRVQMNYDAFIEETCALLMLFLGALPVRKMSYREAFQCYAGLDPFAPSNLAEKSRALGIDLATPHQEEERDTWLDLILSHAIEPQLGRGELLVLHDYPPSQAALARLTHRDGLSVAERFEIYHEGVELANGYHELSDAIELRLRFEEQNRRRCAAGKAPYPHDEEFLASLKTLPDCCGVSVGFDRLMLLRHHCASLKEVLL